MHSFEGAFLDAEFSEFLNAIEADDRESALQFIRGFRELLEKRDPLDRDETLDWLSEKVGKIADKLVFSKVVDFLVENDLVDKGKPPAKSI
ncbi:MAG: hypothetical protein V1820_02070 [archaeon]